MKTYRRIVIATDFSPSSRKALDEALDLATDGRGEVLIVHVYQPPAMLPTDIGGVPAAYTELDATLRENDEKELLALAAEARQRGVAATARLLAGRPSEAIVHEAKREGADLIVMGTVGRHGLPGILLGSVAARVAATASCPVLTLRAEPSDVLSPPAVG